MSAEARAADAAELQRSWLAGRQQRASGAAADERGGGAAGGAEGGAGGAGEGAVLAGAQRKRAREVSPPPPSPARHLAGDDRSIASARNARHGDNKGHTPYRIPVKTSGGHNNPACTLKTTLQGRLRGRYASADVSWHRCACGAAWGSKWVDPAPQGQISSMDEIWLTRPSARGKAPRWRLSVPRIPRHPSPTVGVGWHRWAAARRSLLLYPASYSPRRYTSVGTAQPAAWCRYDRRRTSIDARPAAILQCRAGYFRGCDAAEPRLRLSLLREVSPAQRPGTSRRN